jgi:hypothetical protein
MFLTFLGTCFRETVSGKLSLILEGTRFRDSLWVLCWELALGNLLWRTCFGEFALGTCFENSLRQLSLGTRSLWELASGKLALLNFLRELALGNLLWELALGTRSLWQLILGTRFGDSLALGTRFGDSLWEFALGTRFKNTLREFTLGNLLWGICFGELVF